MKQPNVLWIALFVFALIVASRLLAVGDVRMDHDEVRSVSRTLGTPAQIIEWQPPDWPPLYYLTLGAYRIVAGMQPIVVRLFSVFWFALSLAMVYRLSLRISHRRRAAILSMAAYASLGMVLFQSTHVRGYVMTMALYPLAFWWMLRLFEADKPRWQDIFGLGITCALLFYVTYSAAPGFIMLGLFTLIAYPIKRVWRWIPPAIIAVIVALPQFFRLAGHILPTLTTREQARAAGQTFVLEPYSNYQRQIIESYTGAALPLWIVLVVLVIVLLLWRERPLKRTTIALGIVAIIGPIFAAAVMPFFGLAVPHYSWWAVFPIVALTGHALSYLPRYIWQGVVGVMLIFPIANFPVDLPDLRYGNEFMTPFEDTFNWLQQHMNPGDVIYLGEVCRTTYEKCGTSVEWDYYQMVYFPDRRLQFVETIPEPEEARRVWYVHVDGWNNEVEEGQILKGRVPAEFYGPWDFLWRLYEAPPDSEGVFYENGMRFHGYDMIDPRLGGGIVNGPVVRREGEALILRLWWSVDETPERDYSISTLIAPGVDSQPLVQLDAPPQTIDLYPLSTDAPPTATSQWQSGQIYVEERVLTLPDDIDSALRDVPIGIYMTLYQWWDGVVIDAPGVEENGRRRLRDMFILTY